MALETGLRDTYAMIIAECADKASVSEENYLPQGGVVQTKTQAAIEGDLLVVIRKTAMI